MFIYIIFMPIAICQIVFRTYVSQIIIIIIMIMIMII